MEEGVLSQLNDHQRELWSQQSELTRQTIKACLCCDPSDRIAAVDMKEWACCKQAVLIREISILTAKNTYLTEELSAAKAREEALLQRNLVLEEKVKHLIKKTKRKQKR